MSRSRTRQELFFKYFRQIERWALRLLFHISPVFSGASFYPFCPFRKAHLLAALMDFLQWKRRALIYLQRSCLVCEIFCGRNPPPPPIRNTRSHFCLHIHPCRDVFSERLHEWLRQIIGYFWQDVIIPPISIQFIMYWFIEPSVRPHIFSRKFSNVHQSYKNVNSLITNMHFHNLQIYKH